MVGAINPVVDLSDWLFTGKMDVKTVMARASNRKDHGMEQTLIP